MKKIWLLYKVMIAILRKCKGLLRKARSTTTQMKRWRIRAIKIVRMIQKKIKTRTKMEKKMMMRTKEKIANKEATKR
jgi:hypothetical protein